MDKDQRNDVALLLLQERDAQRGIIFESRARQDHETLAWINAHPITEDEDGIAWNMAKALVVPNLYDFLQEPARNMTVAEAERITLENVRELQQRIDDDPWTFGVVQNQEQYIERGIMNVCDAAIHLHSIFYGTPATEGSSL